MWDMAAIHALLVAVGLYCLVHYPSRASETHGHYVAMPAGSAALGTTWAEEAANEAEQLELDLEAEPAAAAEAETDDGAWTERGAPRPAPL